LIKISVASGKGGTGKTTIATNLAAALSARGKHVAYLDCDVEEPNGGIFLKPTISAKSAVSVLVPQIDLEKCTFCGDCAAICEFNAIAVLKDNVIVFDSLCHSCGGCYHVCPEDAIKEVPRQIGEIQIGAANGLKFMEGRLNIGESQAPPVTRQLKRGMPASDIVIIDAPPGTSCPVIEAISNTDYLILVSEPTPFGLNDLRLAVGMARELKLPFGVIINRSDLGDNLTEDYCKNEGIEILLRIPFNRKIAEAYSDGRMACHQSDNYGENLYRLYENIAGRITND